MNKKIIAIAMTMVLIAGLSAIVIAAATNNATGQAGVGFRATNIGVFPPPTGPNPSTPDPNLPPGLELRTINIDFGLHDAPITSGSGPGGRVSYASMIYAREAGTTLANTSGTGHVSTRTADIYILAADPNLDDWTVSVAVSGFTIGSSTPTLNNFYLDLIPNGTLQTPNGTTYSGNMQAAMNMVAGGAAIPVAEGGRGIFGARFEGVLHVVPLTAYAGEAQAVLTWTFLEDGPGL